MNHNKALDSLRGLSALSVFFCHLYSQNDFKYTNRLIFTCGNEAVIMFFILSGFVLSIGFNNRNIKYTNYLTRRVLRIYPVYFSVLILALLLNCITQKILLNGYIVLRSLILITQTSVSENLVYPSWSLSYEAIISIFIMPLIWRARVSFLLIIFIIISLFNIFTDLYIHIPIQHGFPIDKFIIGIIYYTNLFISGTLIYHYKEQLKKVSALWYLPIYLLMFFNFFITFTNGLLSIVAIGAAGILITVYHNNSINRLFSKPILIFVGKISYPFYLVHAIIITLFFDLYKNVYPKTIYAFVFSILVAYILHVTIEIPFNNIGKKITIK